MLDRLDLLEQVLEKDGFSPEVLEALRLIVEELRYLRDRADRKGQP